MSIVIWVDEDDRIWAPERRLLTGLGYLVEALADATTALHYISDAETADLGLIILDVMLLQGSDPRFANENAGDGLNAGLVLARLILNQAPSLCTKMILFSRATDPSHIAHIRREADSMRIPYLRKNPDTQGRHFIKWLVSKGLLDPPTNP